MLPELYHNKPRDFLVDEGHCAITQLKTQRIDYRALVPGARDHIEPGMKIIRIMSENAGGEKIPSGAYFVIVVHTVRTESFAHLQKNKTFLAATPEKTATQWSQVMQQAYANKRTSRGEIAFPGGLQPKTRFIVYDFTPILLSNAQEFLMAQYLYYKGKLPPQIKKDWQTHYGQTAIDNIIRRCKGLL